MSETQTPLLSITKSAELVGVHPNTIRNRINEGKLPAIRSGRNIIRIKQTDLESLFTPYRGGEFGIWTQI
jgi:excisionase family DNA binding protein